MGWLTDNPTFRKVLWFIAVILDCFLSYMWWLSLTTTHDRLKKLLWFMCALYMVYAIPSAVMYFNNEMVRKETVVTNNNFEIDVIKKRLLQIENELNPVATYKENEAKTGYRTRSQAVKADKDSLVLEQNDKLAQLKELTKENTANGNSNPFNGFRWFMGLIVGITVFIFYFGEFLIIWAIVEEGKKASETNTKLTQSEDATPLSKVLPKVSEDNQSSLTSSDTIPTESEDEPSLTSEQLKKIDFVNALWGDSKEELPTSLTPLERTGFPERTANKYSDYLRDIGAIVKVQGRPCKPKWSLSKIIRYIENEEAS
jgi:hypothetical protein